MNKTKNYKEFLKDLLYSIFKTTNLFKFAIYKWITPLIVFILIGCVMTIPSIVSYNNLTVESLTSNVSYVDKVLSHVLAQDIKCSINDSKFTCDEGFSYEELYEFQNNNDDTIRYKIYINTNITEVFEVGNFGEHSDTDNYIIFFEESFRYRYSYHNPRTETVDEYVSLGAYDKLNGTDFHQIYENSLQSEDSNAYLLNETNRILLDGYKSIAYEVVYITAVSNIGMYFLFLLIVSLLIKGSYLLKKNKGFKFTQSLKIAIMSSIQSALIALFLSLFGMDFVNCFGLALTIRSLYIYIRYTGSRKNTIWLDDLYKLTNDERFNI